MINEIKNRFDEKFKVRTVTHHPNSKVKTSEEFGGCDECLLKPEEFKSFLTLSLQQFGEKIIEEIEKKNREYGLMLEKADSKIIDGDYYPVNPKDGNPTKQELEDLVKQCLYKTDGLSDITQIIKEMIKK